MQKMTRFVSQIVISVHKRRPQSRVIVQCGRFSDEGVYRRKRSNFFAKQSYFLANYGVSARMRGFVAVQRERLNFLWFCAHIF